MELKNFMKKRYAEQNAQNWSQDKLKMKSQPLTRPGARPTGRLGLRCPMVMYDGMGTLRRRERSPSLTKGRAQYVSWLFRTPRDGAKVKVSWHAWGYLRNLWDLFIYFYPFFFLLLRLNSLTWLIFKFGSSFFHQLSSSVSIPFSEFFF